MEAGRKDENVLFNDALNTFHLRLYGVRHMVQNHSDRERENPLPPHGLVFFICHRQDNTHHGLCYTSRGALAGTRNAWRLVTITDKTCSHCFLHSLIVVRFLV